MSIPELYDHAINPLFQNFSEEIVKKPVVSSTGALCVYSGKITDRLPHAKRIVQDENTKNTINWNNVNIPITTESYKTNWLRARDFLNSSKNLYLIDGYLGWDIKTRMKIRVLTTLPYHALFVSNCLINPTENELLEFNKSGPDFTVFDACNFKADIPGDALIGLNFTENNMCILGTQYAGELKKGLFTVLNYYMPLKGNLSMHSSANEGVNEITTLFLGASESGKTTLSADLRRRLIGDDELVWTENGLFNLEGGCYAKCSNLNPKKETQIYSSIKFGTILENVKFSDPHKRIVNYNDLSITSNTRASYPLSFMPDSKIPAIGSHPKNIIFLTLDRYGIFPIISKLTPEQAIYYYMSGYTTRIISDTNKQEKIIPFFTACYGQSYLPLNPMIYANLLYEKICKYKCDVWMLNTGNIRGTFPNGERVPLKVTRAIIDSINFGELSRIEYDKMPIFDIIFPKYCLGVRNEMLNPMNLWENHENYMKTVKEIAQEFIENFKKYETEIDKNIINSGPKFN